MNSTTNNDFLCHTFVLPVMSESVRQSSVGIERAPQSAEACNSTFLRRSLLSLEENQNSLFHLSFSKLTQTLRSKKYNWTTKRLYFLRPCMGKVRLPKMSLVPEIFVNKGLDDKVSWSDLVTRPQLSFRNFVRFRLLPPFSMSTRMQWKEIWLLFFFTTNFFLTFSGTKTICRYRNF